MHNARHVRSRGGAAGGRASGGMLRAGGAIGNDENRWLGGARRHAGLRP
jgi:hypothetical protein